MIARDSESLRKRCLCVPLGKNTFYKALALLMTSAQLSGGATQDTHGNDMPSLLLPLTSWVLSALSKPSP